ncbi:MAG: hypothetical protein ACKVK2_05940 [Flavobacteriales bacterium]|jgi:hypothetical protein|tara:strand:+ start:44 stop:1168 length:1125 start_codon:yes stop_codon:yes gene_type:complete
MKKILIVCFLTLVSFSIQSQNELGKSDDEARIVLSTFIPDDILENAPSARKLFATKLGQIATRNGMGGGGASGDNRFIISGDINILTKDITATAPVKYLVTIETTLAVGDGIDGKAFSTEYVEFKGIGNSEDKAFISAIRKINPRHKLIKQVIQQGKEKIIEYYNSRCDFILKEASALADSRKFDEAIFLLNQVPEVTKDCYDKSMDLAVEIIKRKFEFECQSKISEAKALIATGDFSGASQILNFFSQDMDCYSDVEALLKQINVGLCSKYLGEARGHWANRNSSSAANALAKINASSPCYQESLQVAKEISGYLDEKEQRDWDLNYEKYKDNLAVKNRKLDNAASMIKAARDVGVAYGKNQPKSVTYTRIIK